VFGKPFVSKLLDFGANPNLAGSVEDVPGALMTALMVAVHEKQEETVQLLLSAGADPAPANSDGYTALHIAAQIGFIAGVQMLLEAGAPTDVMEANAKMTPLGIAVEHNVRKVIDAFREYNGDEYAQGEEVALRLTHETFTKEINGRAALVFFYAPWCDKCQRVHPVWEEVARSVKGADIDLVVAKIDATDANVAQTHKINEFPNIQLFPRNMGKGKQWKGARYYDAIMHIIDKYAAADANTDFDTEPGFNTNTPHADSASNEPAEEASKPSKYSEGTEL
jgi:thiol-disulfide isomerase/thioredoxin